MHRADLDGISLEFAEVGVGDPVVFVHGAFLADAFRVLCSERRLATGWRLITYSRRGYGGSSAADGPLGLSEQADDCRRLLGRLGVAPVHVVGHSFGGTIALRLARDFPELVHTLILLEPGLLIGESAPLYARALEDSARRYRETGARVAVDEFLESRWPGYRDPLDRLLPGAFERAVVDAGTFFESEVPAVTEAGFDENDAREIRQPVLVVRGERSGALHPRFAETHQRLLDWLPRAEGFVLPRSAHLLPLENPGELAAALVRFLERHPLPADSGAPG